MNLAWKFMIPMVLYINLVAAALWHFTGPGLMRWFTSGTLVLGAYLLLGNPQFERKEIGNEPIALRNEYEPQMDTDEHRFSEKRESGFICDHLCLSVAKTNDFNLRHHRRIDHRRRRGCDDAAQSLHSALALRWRLGLAAAYLQLAPVCPAHANPVYVAVAILDRLRRSAHAGGEASEKSVFRRHGSGARRLRPLCSVCWRAPSITVRQPASASPQPSATVKEIGTDLMTKYILPLEVIGLLLTAALIARHHRHA